MRHTATPAATPVCGTDGLVLTARFPRLILWVKAGGGGRRMFFRALSRSALGSELSDAEGKPLPVDATDDGLEAYVVFGPPEGLKAAVLLPCVARAEFVLDTKPPRCARGTGPEKAPPGKPGKAKAPDATEWSLTARGDYTHPGQTFSPAE